MVVPTTAQVLVFFNLFAGVMLTLSLILFLGGFVMYLVRLGTWPTYRDEAITLMKYGVSTLFVLIVILGIQQFLMSHLLVAVSIGALILIFLVAWAFMTATAAPPAPPANGEKDEDKCPYRDRYKQVSHKKLLDSKYYDEHKERRHPILHERNCLIPIGGPCAEPYQVHYKAPQKEYEGERKHHARKQIKKS